MTISASRRVVVFSLLQYDSCPSHDDVGGFFFDFEAIRTALTEMLRAGEELANARIQALEARIGGELIDHRSTTFRGSELTVP